MIASIAEGLAKIEAIRAQQPQLSPDENLEHDLIHKRLYRAEGDLRRAKNCGDAKKTATAERAVARHKAALQAFVEPRVGHLWAPERIIAKSEGRWSGPSGRGVHRQECEMVLDHKDISGPSYRTVRVVKDEGGPPTNARQPFQVMGVAWYAIEDQIRRGAIVVL